ncbi:MAG TPA: hypothetical protein VHE53_05745 [Patescibacteria group bacterium]|nr:hypothetical protein [Patescibacteria group bacterium]
MSGEYPDQGNHLEALTIKNNLAVHERLSLLLKVYDSISLVYEGTNVNQQVYIKDMTHFIPLPLLHEVNLEGEVLGIGHPGTGHGEDTPNDTYYLFDAFGNAKKYKDDTGALLAYELGIDARSRMSALNFTEMGENEYEAAGTLIGYVETGKVSLDLAYGDV